MLQISPVCPTTDRITYARYLAAYISLRISPLSPDPLSTRINLGGFDKRARLAAACNGSGLVVRSAPVLIAPGYGTKQPTFVDGQSSQGGVFLYNGVRGLSGWGCKLVRTRKLSYVAYRLDVSFFQAMNVVCRGLRWQDKWYAIDAKGI